jgi:hypothetical protein
MKRVPLSDEELIILLRALSTYQARVQTNPSLYLTLDHITEEAISTLQNKLAKRL